MQTYTKTKADAISEKLRGAQKAISNEIARIENENPDDPRIISLLQKIDVLNLNKKRVSRGGYAIS